MTPAHPDMFAVPDPDSVIQLPWKPGVAWLAADLVDGRRGGRAGPRASSLKRLIAARPKEGLSAHEDRRRVRVLPDQRPTATRSPTPRHPGEALLRPSALMRRYDVISEICDAMLELGWGPYQNDHEDANGQFEMNWDYDDCLVTADRHAFFKYMVKSIAEKHGLRATFMPKPFAHLTGNGCHAHVSLWDKAGKKNLFDDGQGRAGPLQAGLPLPGRHHEARRALAAITNPTVNSYKRINAPVTSSGATWSPNTVTYTGNNRTHMIRIPRPGPLRAASGRWRGQSLPAAGRRARGRPRRHRQQARPGQAPRHQHVHRRCGWRG